MISRRRFVAAGSVLAASSLLACDRIPAALLWGGLDADDGPFVPPDATERDAVTHALNRLSFGARPGDHARVRALAPTADAAAAAYVREQLDGATHDDTRADRALRPLGMLELPVGELYEYKAPVLLDALTRATLLRATYSERQLHEVMAEFWRDHFNVDASKGDCRWLTAALDREVIRPHALGHFRDLVRGVLTHPAMLWYLDGRLNRRASEAERPNENHARELLELHTLGVHGGYSQQDVFEVARALSGWTVRSKGGEEGEEAARCSTSAAWSS